MGRKGKRIKTAVRNVKQVIKSVKTVKRASKKSASKKAAKKKVETRKATPSRSYKLSDLKSKLSKKGKRFSTFDDYLAYLESNADSIDAMLKPGEFFAAKYFKGITQVPYTSIRLLTSKLREYQATKKYGSDTGPDGRELLKKVNVMTFTSSHLGADEEETEEIAAREYRQKKVREVKRRERKNMETEETVKKLVGVQPGARKTRIDLLSDAAKSMVAMQAQLSEALKRIAELEARGKRKAKKKQSKTGGKKNVNGKVGNVKTRKETGKAKKSGTRKAVSTKGKTQKKTAVKAPAKKAPAKKATTKKAPAKKVTAKKVSPAKKGKRK